MGFMGSPNSTELYRQILGISYPWIVSEVRQDVCNKEITVKVEHFEGEKGNPCPECGEPCSLYDHRVRKLRHLDTCNFKTMVEVNVPRLRCEKHGIWQMPVGFAEKNSRYTMLFEAAVIEWLKTAPTSEVAKSFKLGWDAVDGIMQRAINRGLSRRKEKKVEAIGIDETSNAKGHDYVTVILNKDEDSVIDVLDDRKAETLTNWFKTQKTCNFRGLKSISMDMWDPFIKAVKENIEGAEEKIAFDRFHVSKHINDAVDKVRKREHRDFMAMTGGSPLSKTRFEWLTNSNRTDNRSSKRREFLNLTRLNLVTARAWRIKEQVSMMWDYLYMNVAEKAWKKVLRWISLCRIPEMIKAGKTIRNYFWGILNAIRLKTTNTMLEAKNNCIQRIKNMACGFRNKVRFKRAILFHLGKLDMGFSTIFPEASFMLKGRL
jgi:transposase